MNEKKDPPKRKTIPRQMVMKEAFEANYGLSEHQAKELGPCFSCKNRLDLPCEGCEHWDNKKHVLGKHTKLVDMVLSHLRSPSMLRHDIVESLMDKRHKLEEELENTDLNLRSERDELRGMIYGLQEAERITRETD